MPLPSWRFDADCLSAEERFGYKREMWPLAAPFIGLQPGQRVLDVGTGAGALVRFAAEAMGGRGEITAIDHDPDLLEKARASMPSTPELRVRFEEGSALKLPVPDASFDVTLSGFLLCVMPEPLEALREMRRVTRPGGVVASFSCFCKSGIFPVFEGVHAFDGADRLPALLQRFRDVRRVQVRNPALGLPSGRETTVQAAAGTVYRERGPAPDLDVWADYARAGLTDPRIRGFMTVFAPSDARWSDEDAREYVESRRKLELQMIDALTPAQRATMAGAGFPGTDLAELRALMERKYAWLLADDARIRRGMELVCDPCVLIVGRAP